MAECKRKILIAVDGSDNATHAVNWFIDNIYRDGDYIVFGYSLEAPSLPAMTLTSGMSVPVDTWSKGLTERIQNAETLKNKYQGTCECKKIPNDFVIETAPKPGEGILKMASNNKCQLIVMGTRGLGTVRRAVFGSVSDFVVHNAEVPVTIVPHH